MLNHHRELAWGGEMQYLVDCVLDDGTFPEVTQYREWLTMNRVFRGAPRALDPALDYPGLLNAFLNEVRNKADKPRVGATVHIRFDRLLAIWPQARYIHLVRDPRDVARSVIPMGWAGNTWTGVQRWIDAEELWGKMRQHLPQERTLDVKFEELLADPAAILGNVCAFLDLPYDPCMLDYAEDTTYDVPNPDIAYAWKRKATMREIQLVEARVADLLTECGYVLSDHPRIELSPQEIARLHRQDWRARILHSINRYGIWLYTANFLANRLKLAGLQRTMTLRMQEKDRRTLK